MRIDSAGRFPWRPATVARVKPRICICCGELISKETGAPLRQCENLCCSCANFIEESTVETSELELVNSRTESILKVIGVRENTPA